MYILAHDLGTSGNKATLLLLPANAGHSRAYVDEAADRSYPHKDIPSFVR